MSIKIFDTHSHYDDSQFDEDRQALLTELFSGEIGRLVDVGADMESSRQAVALAEKYPQIYAAVGVHPSNVQGMSAADIQELKALCQHEKVKAVGEIGFDYYWPEPDHTLQKQWFSAQLQLAMDVNLPIIIHSRDAAKDTYDVLKSEYHSEKGGIIHCFSYSKEMARQFLDLGFYIGLGGVVTFKNAKAAKEVAAYVPADRLVLETDCPYLAPHPFRGKRNDSRYLPYVVAEIAAIRGVSEEELIQQTWDNACRVYQLS